MSPLGAVVATSWERFEGIIWIGPIIIITLQCDLRFTHNLVRVSFHKFGFVIGLLIST